MMGNAGANRIEEQGPIDSDMTCTLSSVSHSIRVESNTQTVQVCFVISLKRSTIRKSLFKQNESKIDQKFTRTGPKCGRSKHTKRENTDTGSNTMHLQLANSSSHRRSNSYHFFSCTLHFKLSVVFQKTHWCVW